jgi:hypothetical protein
MHHDLAALTGMLTRCVSAAQGIHYLIEKIAGYVP